ncbi:MAG: MOSC domain-containing protein [Gammaproteobacteria bacterium]|nr:MOSC domain-containing protein [Gammaproteobacteria bacterium]
MNLSVSQLFLHPLKSAAALEVASLEFDQRGPKFDRQWMVVDQAGKFVTQRHHAKMCLIQPHMDGTNLSLTAPSMSLLSVPQPRQSRSVAIWQDLVTAGDCGDLAATWLSDYLGFTCRLVVVINDTQRQVDTDYALANETVGFADGFPVLLVSQASLDEFNSHLDEPIQMQRFRPNIVIDGCAAYAEDDWQRLSIGGLELTLVKPCSRCIMPSIDPATGHKQLQVNAALMATRRRDRETFFGQNAVHRGVGSVLVGQAVELLEA